MATLDGRVALITGCGRLKGLGRSIATAVAREGAHVVLTDVAPEGTRNEAEAGEPEAAAGWRGLPSLAEELESLGVSVLWLVGDVGNKADADRMVSDAIQHFGGVDILVNNAGNPHGANRTWTWLVPEEAWDEEFRINTKGTFLMSSAVTRHLIERGAPGRIINISSFAGKRGAAQRAAYCSSKFAVIGLTESMAQELAAHRITVNAICPGVTDTARVDSSRAKQRSAEAMSEGYASPPPTPIGRMGIPNDIARAVVFLAAPEADFITGISLSIDGGLMIGAPGKSS